MQIAKIEYWETEEGSGKWNWHAVAANGAVLFQGTQGYENKSRMITDLQSFGVLIAERVGE